MGAGLNASDFIGAWRQGCQDFCIGFTLNCKHNHILTGDTDQFSSGLCFEAIPNIVGLSLFHADGLNSHIRARVCISNRIFDSITIAIKAGAFSLPIAGSELMGASRARKRLPSATKTLGVNGV